MAVISCFRRSMPLSKYGMGQSSFHPFRTGKYFWGGGGTRAKWLDPGMVQVPYMSLVRSLIYLDVCTRPDLAMAVSTLSQYCQNP